MNINRLSAVNTLQQGFRNHPIVAILGPRQCGKTTLARQFMAEEADFSPNNYFDLEDPTHLTQLEDPKLALQQRSGLIIIDEIQRLPDLFPLLRVLVDEPNSNRRFLILGSASRELIRQSSESLAGRIRYCELTPFTYQEVDHMNILWNRGGFPRSYLAHSDADSWDWRKHYARTYLEQDIPNLGFNIPPTTLQRFWMMLTHYHGQTFKASEIGKSLGVSDTTVRRYLDILTGTFMVRQLNAWHENIDKRQVKLPKIYFRDSGLFHYLAGIPDQEALLTNPKLGASWEGFALESVIQHHKATPEECYFWGVHGQAELDLLIVKDGKRLGFEIKYTSTPKATKSMEQALSLLNLDSLTVIIPGQHQFPLKETIEVFGLETYLG